MLMLFLNQKSAREMEKTLGQYGQWMEKLRRYAWKRFQKEIREDKLPGCVLREDLTALCREDLSRDARGTADWCWVVDAVCRRLQTWEEKRDVERYEALLRLYYGFGLDAEAQAEWMERPVTERRAAVMRAAHMEQTTFYQLRAEFLTALYTAGVQRGLYRPFPEERPRARRDRAVS